MRMEHQAGFSGSGQRSSLQGQPPLRPQQLHHRKPERDVEGKAGDQAGRADNEVDDKGFAERPHVLVTDLGSRSRPATPNRTNAGTIILRNLQASATPAIDIATTDRGIWASLACVPP
jgi:hypothetical protein